MKKLSALLLAVIIIFSFAACGGAGEESGNYQQSETPAAADDAASQTADESETSEPAVSNSDETTIASAEIHAFDVGEGLALLVDSGQTEIIIDGGYKQYGEPFADYIRPYVDGDIELVVATHSHADHVGGLTAIYDEYQVDKTIYGDEGKSGQFKAFWEAANNEPNSSVINDEDMTIDFDGGLSITTIETVDDDSNTNNNSVVSLLDVGGVKTLVTGDAEDKIERKLAGAIGDVDIYVVGHHGSETSSTQALLEEIRPEVCIISSEGPTKKYENPNWFVMERLLDFTPEIYATYISGNIVVTVDDGDISVPADDGDRLTLDNYGGTKSGAAAGAKAKLEAGESGAAANSKAEADVEEAATEETADDDTGTDPVVYVTNTGGKYHVDGCRYLKKSKIEISLSHAKNQGYEPCSVCHPPE
ncbi:MAG: MBL fold metallo-hydrolase [Clostridiales Family XIII bacterium]|jgi:competence protein ComEC|nr:MBL fold metallo-hydrolase [Clostridiales Family XIII bacterium]